MEPNNNQPRADNSDEANPHEEGLDQPTATDLPQPQGGVTPNQESAEGDPPATSHAPHSGQQSPLNGSPHQIVFDPSIARPTAARMKVAQIDSAEHQSLGDDPFALELIGTGKARRRPSARNNKTEAQYMKRVRCLYRQSSAIRTTDIQNPIDPSPAEVVQDLIDSASAQPSGAPPRRARASWALYRSSLLWHLSSRRHQNDVYETAYQLLASTKSPAGVKSTKPRAKKTFSGNDFAMIITALGSLNALQGLNLRRSFWGSQTAYWLQAGVAAGARGAEWEGAAWLDRDKFQLLIPNAKRKKTTPAFFKIAGAANAKIAAGSANESAQTVYDLDNEDLGSEDLGSEYDDDEDDWEAGPFEVDVDSHRIVRIDPNDAIYVDLHLASIERNTIHQQLKNNTPRSESFIRYYEMARRTLRSACEIAFKGKRYYRLYNTRSQFSANRKVDHQLGAVAAMMGHFDPSSKTTMSSYGSRAAGLKSRKAQSDLLSQVMMEAFQPKNDSFSPIDAPDDTFD